MKLFLASASPRRKEILSMLPFEFNIHIPDFDEKKYELELKNQGLSNPAKISKLLAREKANKAYEELKNTNKDICILSADTIVCLDNIMYGKGLNKENSTKILKELRNKKHTVITSVCILTNKKKIEFSTKTNVYFDNYSDEIIDYYLENYKPYDKAGAYGIQDAGAILIKKISGSFHNVMGLPIREVFKILKNI